jgi:hypothetical protein
MTDSPYPGTPSWVKVFGLITLIVAVLFAILHIAGGGIGSFEDHFHHGMSADRPAVAILRQGAQS